MINYSNLKIGERILLNNQPYEITESSIMFKGRGHSTTEVRLRNLITGESVTKTFHPSDSFDEPEVLKIKINFVYSHKDKFIFSKIDNPKDRFELTKKQLGNSFKFLKNNQIVEGIVFNNDIVSISLPIKIELKVEEAPPGIKGDRAQGGTKVVVLETGAEVNAPLFVKEGDILEINTEKGEYVRRVEKE